MSEPLDTTVLADLNDMQRMIPALAEAEIVVGHIWRKEFPEAPRAQAAAGGDGRDRYARPALAAARHHLVQRLRPRAGDRRIRADDVPGVDPSAGRHGGGVSRRRRGRRTSRPADRRTAKSSARPSASSATAGSAARWRSGPFRFGCKVIAANRSPVAEMGDAAEIYPLAELDHMLPQCDAAADRGRARAGDQGADRRPPPVADEADRAVDQHRTRRDRRRGGALRCAERQRGSAAPRSMSGGTIGIRRSPTGRRRASRFISWPTS